MGNLGKDIEDKRRLKKVEGMKGKGIRQHREKEKQRQEKRKDD